MQGWQGQREIAEGRTWATCHPSSSLGQLFVQIPLAGSIQGDPSKLRKIPGAVRCSDCIKNDEKTVAAGQAQATKAKAAIGKAKARKNKVKKVAQKTRATSEGPLLFLWWSAVVHELFNVFFMFFLHGSSATRLLSTVLLSSLWNIARTCDREALSCHRLGSQAETMS